MLSLHYDKLCGVFPDPAGAFIILPKEVSFWLQRVMSKSVRLLSPVLLGHTSKLYLSLRGLGPHKTFPVIFVTAASG